MNRSMQFIIGLVALALALGAGFYGRNAYLTEVSTVQIAVPVQAIQPYTVLSPDLFSLREVPRAMQNPAILPKSRRDERAHLHSPTSGRIAGCERPGCQTRRFPPGRHRL